MTDIEHLARRQLRIAKLTKKLDERKKQLREKFFSYANENTPDYTLPSISVNVPVKFFEATGMSQTDFLASRYPSWTLKATSQTDLNVTFVLQKRPEYVTYTAGEKVQITRSISELTPEVDWDTMKVADPELFKVFAKPVTTYELDADVFQKMMANDPSFDAQGFLARHSKHKAPTLRVLAKELKDDE